MFDDAILPMRRIGLIAPMGIELDPLVELLDLVSDTGTNDHHGRYGRLELIATVSTMGMAAGARAAEHLLGRGAEFVFVVGIAGGVGPGVDIGALVTPAAVIDRRSGTSFVPAAIEGVGRSGIVSCGDDFITDRTVLGDMFETGVIAVDMETAAVAAACQRAGRPWAAFRAISDDAGGGLVTAELFSMTLPDGSADRSALAAYVAADPTRGEALARLTADTRRATRVAAEAAVRAIDVLAR